MTVHVHTTNESVGYGNHHHYRSEATESSERTWQFECDGPCEERILGDVEHSARTPGSVPLTVTEAAEAELLEKVAHDDVNKMAQALTRLAKDQVAAATA